MHLAICDDHIADRKQMERLLGRESVKRQQASGDLYVDSFGNRTAFLNTPMIYDAVFLDMTQDENCARDIINTLRERDCVIPVVLCCSSINYREYDDLNGTCYYLDKPIRQDELSGITDILLEIKQSQVLKLEFRSDTDTFYLEEEEIMYGTADDRHVPIHTTDNRDMLSVSTLLNFASNLGIELEDSFGAMVKFPIVASATGPFLLIGYHAVVNINHIKNVTAFYVIMRNDKQFKIPLGAKKKIEKIKNSYLDSHQN